MGDSAILCVDDEPAVLRTTELVLNSVGYAVSTAATAAEAFRLLKSQYFDLLLLDCITDGGWVVQEAKRINPNMRVAIWTGDAELVELPPVDIVFHKPISPPVLLRQIAELLSSSKAA